MKFKILTLGCKVNQAESSGLASVLRGMQLEDAETANDADILIVNSCAVTAESVRKAKQLLRSLKRKNPGAKRILTGCWPQAFPADDFSEADFVTGTKNREALLEWITAQTDLPQKNIPTYSSGDVFSPLPCADTTRTRAFLKIQDGCNQFCSYCIIPFARGRCRSMPPERLLSEVRALAEAGFREIVLTGINLGFFGTDTGQTLADAVELCAAQEGILRVRLGSLEPERMDAETLRRFAACEKFCPQFHLSLQSGCDAVLRRMNRRYDTAQYRSLAEEIHRLFPDAALTTDVIVGFPGETDEQFEETCRFVQEIGFTKVHVFPYSVREGTRAASFPDQVPQDIKMRRAETLTGIANEIRKAHLRQFVGQQVSVLVEGEKQQNAQRFYQGHTPDGTLVKIFPENAEKGLQNSAICVTIETYEDDCLCGFPSTDRSARQFPIPSPYYMILEADSFMAVYRIYTEKKPQYAVEAQSVLSDLRTALRLDVQGIRVLNRYDADRIEAEDFQKAIPTVFSEPAVDYVYEKLPLLSNQERIFAVEYLPGQFDQRADSCEQCIQILNGKERCRVRNARIYIVSGILTDAEFDRLKAYLINPVESREASLETVDTLDMNYALPETVETLDGFCELNAEGREKFLETYALAMDFDDITFCQEYFRDTEHRDPTITEIRMIDTYWSDHCRHTTFLTTIDKVKIETPYIKDAYEEYLSIRKELGRENKPITLMDMATMAMRKLKADGKIPALDESEEINACSVKIKVDTDKGQEDWILMFKNETHNHPTEIEPFGGAATCLGGAIRDPLSGRSYVYQAMRVTGAANPLIPVSDTIPGKLPQRKITVGAANGYSSYGNQIGLATGHVSEVYHPGYVAKRMEIGAVVGAAPAENIRRERPAPGDIIILLGGKTGRDGCGGATGSSKSHTLESLTHCGAEVQKGNPPEERKLQRLFRDPAVTKLIKRCNDFGAGGVSVAIGELTDGLDIDLNAVPKKYDGLDGTELAISESQERMAVVVAPEDVDAFMAAAAKENLLATVVAKATDTNRLRMNWNGKTIVDLSREFLNSNGAEKHTNIIAAAPTGTPQRDERLEDTPEGWRELMSNLNICSQKGLVEKFDSTIGAGTVLMPYGGIYQLTPAQAMAAKIPVLSGETSTCSIMGWGFNPVISEHSPYHGAIYAVIESVAKVIAAGGSWHQCWLTFQEYFERTQNNPRRWGKPFSALLGAFRAQLELSCASIGGKDSMSGTFENIDVPPTLVSFAVSTADTKRVVSTEFKETGSTVIRIAPEYSSSGLPNWQSVRAVFDYVEKLITDGRAKAIWSVENGGVAEGLAKMAFGNHIGFEFTKVLPERILFEPCAGSFIIELNGPAKAGEEVIGRTTEQYKIFSDAQTISLDTLQKAWEGKLESVFPCRIKTAFATIEPYSHKAGTRPAPAVKVAKPRVLIPVFPGTNCEYDTARAFERAGAVPEVLVIRNLSASAIEESVEAAVKLIDNSQMIMIPGGFSGGDEPDGSGKFITAFFRNPKVTEAVHNLLKNRDGLMLGICNGFQALIKLGLVPYGEITEMSENSPTLTFNTIARHQSMMVTTRIASNKSPWLAGCEVGELHTIPISHGEGRFIASGSLLQRMANNGQIATQYVDLSGRPTMDIRFNPNGSVDAIEGITSPDGRILGKMGHSERIGNEVCKNVPGRKDQQIFQSGVRYFAD